MLTTTTSYKLPNLVALTRPFELRTNQNCRAVSFASEQWLLEPTDALDASGREALHDAKTGLSQRSGLLAALCYPTCDAPQLRLVTDFLGLLVCSNDWVIMMQHVVPQWLCESPDGAGQGSRFAISDNVLFKRWVCHVASTISI
jgi:hypothetical protein